MPRKNGNIQHRDVIADPIYNSKLDQVLDKVINKTPNSFISMADFNVVAGKGCPFAPWMDYVGSSGTQIYNKDC